MGGCLVVIRRPRRIGFRRNEFLLLSPSACGELENLRNADALHDCGPMQSDAESTASKHVYAYWRHPSRASSLHCAALCTLFMCTRDDH